jgi:flagellar protein FliO/FliZ
MQWLNELPFADNRVLQIGFLAACGIAALIVLAIFYRLAFAHRLRVPGGRTRQPRLGLVDAFSLDGQRQLVLVRRDNVEHLVMIGGPNDVLVESQISRAVVPARESNQVSPLLVPSAPVRRTEAAPPLAPAPAEAPAKVAAKASASPPAPAPAAPIAPTAAPPIPKAPAPAQASAPAQAPVPAQTPVPAPKQSALEQARPAAISPVAEPARSAAASPSPRQPEPRLAQPRATMPPPIIPASASQNRGPTVRTTEMGPARGPGNPAAPSPVAPAPARRPEKPELAAAASKAEPPPVATLRTEAPAGPTVTVPAATAASVPTPPAPKTPPAARPSNGTQKPADARPQADKTNAAPSSKPLKVDDPFADLDSLEAEMARLLGRERSD